MADRLTQIAVITGLSESRISRVPNGRPGVAEAPARRSSQQFDVLGYERLNQLRSQLDRVVGIVTPQFENPIFPTFAAAIAGT